MVSQLKIICAVSTALLMCSSVLADQCQWVTKEQADAAMSHLKKGIEILSYCEPCESDKGHLLKIYDLAVGIADASSGYYAIKVNGNEQDLAYTFVKDGNVYKNLAKLSKCPATGVSLELKWPLQKSETSNWSGKYVKGQSFFNLINTGKGPSYSIQLDVQDPHQGGRFAQLVGQGELAGSEIEFVTPFEGCRFVLKRPAIERLQVESKGDCGAISKTVIGTYTKN